MPELNIVEKVIALEAVDLLKNLSAEQLSRIGSIAREARYPPGKVIMSPDSNPDALFVILEGSVSMSRDDAELHVAKENEVLGAWALFDPEPMAVTAKAVSDVRLLRIGRDEFYDLLSDNSEITASIFAQLVKRFRQLVER
ncbi:MAG TPA: cyclic nucleotide-binding domain-containing protein [Bryobacteraceae bacterium]|nr:cyclic nucleotide-binding domain-containing protein [Bryobacteraceae bacterium]